MNQRASIGAGRSGVAPAVESLEARELFAVTTTNTRVDISRPITIPDLNEELTIQGKLHINRQGSSGSGAQMTSVLFNPQGVSGTSESGIDYVGNGATQRTTIETPSGMTIVNNVNTFNLISKGGAENSTEHTLVHTVTNADGEVVASVDRSRIINESF